uniref:Protein TIC 214 n=1 Tax=Selaginella remotifolia TaxID=137170 RepID=A0A482CHL7_SELRE|nr:hypothetical chloroplast RF19 [Selaginella remotifolia]QBL76296.1 hypothetical chloroplast RF19 [Selaginella remotifolia]
MQKWASLLCVSRAPMLRTANASGPLIPFGLYCGFAATLPTGLYHALLTGVAPISDMEISGGSVASGSLVGQLVVILSVYYLRLYVTLVKPHAITPLILPYLLFCWHRLSRRLRSGEVNSFRAMKGPRIAVRAHRATSESNKITSPESVTVPVRRSVLLDISSLPLFHHVSALSPAFARLANLLVYRHSDQFLFVISSIGGWLGGPSSLGYLAELAAAVPKTNPCDGFSGPARPVRRLIRRVPSIIVTAFCLSYIGRAPVPIPFPSGSGVRPELEPDGSIQKCSWFDVWPVGIFDYRRGTRPFRYATDCYESGSPAKKEIFQHYFHAGVGSNGKRRFSFSYPPSLQVFGDNMDGYVNKALPPKAGDIPTQRECRIGRRKESYFKKELTDRPEALVGGYLFAGAADNGNGLCNHRKGVLAKTYDPYLGKDLRGGISGLGTIWASTPASWRWVPPDYIFRELPEYFRPHGSAAKNRNTRRGRGYPFIWSDGTTRNYHLSLVAGSLRIHYDTTRLESIFEQVPLCISNLASDTALGPYGTIRSMRARNVSYVVNDRTGIGRILKRPVPQPDYRRNLIIGAMRARRRKTLVWKPLQYQTNSTFSLRILENFDSLQSSLDMDAEPAIPTQRPAAGRERFKYFSAVPDPAGVTKANRIAMAKGWDFSTAHRVRGCPPISQLYFRRNSVLPFLIVAKNVCCPAAPQAAEWREDWDDLDKEIYVGCNHDGGEIPTRGLPSHRHREGVQTKIVNPFRLKRRQRNSMAGRSIIMGDDNAGIDPAARNVSEGLDPGLEAGSHGYDGPEGIEYGFLTVMGYQTALPFGSRKPGLNSSFWRLLRRDARREWRDKIMGIRKMITGRRFRSRFGPDPCAEYPEPVDTNGVPHRGGIQFSHAKPGDRRYSCEADGVNGCPPTAGGVKALHGGEGFKGGPQKRDPRRPGKPKPSVPTNPTISSWVRMRWIQVGTYLSRAPLGSSADRMMLTCRPPIAPNMQLVVKRCARLTKRFARSMSRVRSYVMIYLLIRGEDRPADGEKGVVGLIPTRGQCRVGLVSQAYAFHGVLQLETVNKCPFPADLAQGLYPVSGGEPAVVLDHEPRAARGKDWDKWLRNNLRRYEVPSEIWRSIAPHGWNTTVGRPIRREHSSIGDSQNHYEAQSPPDEAVDYQCAPYAGSGRPADAIRIGKRGKRYQSNLLLQNLLELAPTPVGARVCCSSELQGEAFIPDARVPKGSQNGVLRFGNGGKRIEDRMYARDETDSHSRSWLYMRVLKRFRIFLMSECITMHRLIQSVTRDNISLLGGRAYAGCQGVLYRWAEREAWEDRVNRRDLKSEQVATRIRKIRDAVNTLRAASAVLSFSGSARGVTGAEVEPLYGDLSRSIALLSCYAQADRTKGTLGGSEHRLVEVADDRFMARKMLRVSLNLRTRARTILYRIPRDELVSRIGILRAGAKAISYSSCIGDALLPKRRVELRILESLYRVGPAGCQGTGGFGGVDAAATGSHEQWSGELPTRNTQQGTGSGPRITRSLIWPGYRLEDFSCMNRFRLDTNDGSRFAMPRVCPYPLGEDTHSYPGVTMAVTRVQS